MENTPRGESCSSRSSCWESEGYIHSYVQLGIEVAKNLVLLGIGKLVICDNELVRITDLGSNFFLKEDQVGQITRAEAVLNSLRNLNQRVDVQLSTKKDIDYVSNDFDCVVVSDHY